MWIKEKLKSVIQNVCLFFTNLVIMHQMCIKHKARDWKKIPPTPGEVMPKDYWYVDLVFIIKNFFMLIIYPTLLIYAKRTFFYWLERWLQKMMHALWLSFATICLIASFNTLHGTHLLYQQLLGRAPFNMIDICIHMIILLRMFKWLMDLIQ